VELDQSPRVGRITQILLSVHIIYLPSLVMARPDSRPARANTRGVSMLAALSIIFVAILCLCSTGAKAQHTGSLDGYDNYGAVIGLGQLRCLSTIRRKAYPPVDLGNTYSRVGVRVDGRTHIIANRRRSHSTPSWFMFGDEDILVGEAARDALQSNPEPETTIFDVARLLGRDVNDESFLEEMKGWSSDFREKDGKPVIYVQYRPEPPDWTPEGIVGMIMSEMKFIAEEYLGQKVTHAVLNVPAGMDVSTAHHCSCINLVIM
jgi:heat shock protein 5